MTSRAIVGALLFAWISTEAAAGPLEVRAPASVPGRAWTVVELDGAGVGPLPAGWERRTFWDLRPPQGAGARFRWTLLDPAEPGLAGRAGGGEADVALCASEPIVERRIGCHLLRGTDALPGAPEAPWSDTPERLITVVPRNDAADALETGSSFRAVVLHDGRAFESIDGRVVAEGLALTLAGPREVLLLREVLDRQGVALLRYRMLTATGQLAAVLEGPLPEPGTSFLPARAAVLVETNSLADDGMTIAYEHLAAALDPGTTGFMQRSHSGSTIPLTAVDPSWTSVSETISIDQSGVSYQPDPGDPASEQTLPEVWDFTGLVSGTLSQRTFNTTRNDVAWSSCLESCATRDLSATPPDGTWQAYLKIDRFSAGSPFTRDIFLLNDNDTGANPSIDVPFVAQDELNDSDRTQICFEDSAGGADRFLRFFQFTGATPATAVMGIGDSWTSGNWTSCNDANGLHLTAFSVCAVDACYPACEAPLGADPRARGRIDGGPAGLRMTVLEDGWVHVPAGNYVPALLLRQDTDLEAGIDFFGTCNLGTQRQRFYDYFWVQERYGLLALVSSPNDVAPDYNMPPDDWSVVGNGTDRADFTWGPYPPYQTEARACLSGTRVSWLLPADGSNLDDEAAVSDYGYVVSWGSLADPEALADWDTNPNHTPLPGEPGYLAAPSGGEPTSTVITSWGGSSINATVVTALTYTDPDAGDAVDYRSAAFYKVVEDPARLDPLTFEVGDGVVPFVTLDGADNDLAWPAVAGADGYHVRVFDLILKLEIPCPPGMDCEPAVPATTHPGGAADGGSYGYRAFAVDPCGEDSAN